MRTHKLLPQKRTNTDACGNTEGSAPETQSLERDQFPVIRNSGVRPRTTNKD